MKVSVMEIDPGKNFRNPGRVDKKDSVSVPGVLQAHLHVGYELGTRPDIRR